MKIVLQISPNDFDVQATDIMAIVEWNYPVLPRVGENIFIDSLILLPLEMIGHMFDVWSIDWRFEISENNILPNLWLMPHDESK